MAKAKKENKTYFDRVHMWGRISSVSALCALLMFPMAICLYLGVFPSFKMVFSGLIKLIPVYWLTSIIEVFLYTPMLGAGGTYLSFVTGNIPNLKLPCAINAMNGADVKANSDEGEVISTISIATSSIVTTIVMAVGVLLFAPFLQSFTENELLKPAFAQVLPAIFGALGAGYFIKNWKISFFPIIVMVLILVFSPGMGASTLLFPGIICSVLGAYVMYSLGWLDKKEA